MRQSIRRGSESETEYEKRERERRRGIRCFRLHFDLIPVSD